MADSLPPHAKAKSRLLGSVSNALAIAGFVILIIIVIWGLFHIASLSSGWFGRYFTSPRTSAITVQAPESAVSGRAARVTWTHADAGTGRYAFLYECSSTLEFGIPIVKQGETQPTLARVPCGTAFTLGNATSSLLVVPLLASSTPVTARMNIVYVPESGAQASGSTTMLINPTGDAPAPEPEQPTPEETPVKPTPRPSGGPADLTVSIVSVVTDGSGTSAVTFAIANTGGAMSGSYVFTANLPTAQPYTFRSEPQAPLAPGSSIANTLRFTQTVPGIFTVVVDPGNAVAESSETNNAASREMYR
jgi:hypothetical protein